MIHIKEAREKRSDQEQKGLKYNWRSEDHTGTIYTEEECHEIEATSEDNAVVFGVNSGSRSLDVRKCAVVCPARASGVDLDQILFPHADVPSARFSPAAQPLIVHLFTHPSLDPWIICTQYGIQNNDKHPDLLEIYQTQIDSRTLASGRYRRYYFCYTIFPTHI